VGTSPGGALRIFAVFKLNARGIGDGSEIGAKTVEGKI
jgi:hypothetical protein